MNHLLLRNSRCNLRPLWDIQGGSSMKKLFWFMVVVCFGIVNAQAQSGLSDTRITVFGGASFLGAERTFNSDSENGSEVFKTKYASGMRFGFRATASLT